MSVMSSREYESSKELVHAASPPLERPAELLFDLALDPQEFDNVAAAPAYAAVRADLEANGSAQRSTSQVGDDVVAQLGARSA